MQLDDMVLVSIDDHIIEPADMFERHMPERYRDQAPKYTTGDNGLAVWKYQGQDTGSVGLNAVASWPHQEWGFDPIDHSEMRPGCYDLDLRVRETWTPTVSSPRCASPPSPGSTA